MYSKNMCVFILYPLYLYIVFVNFILILNNTPYFYIRLLKKTYSFDKTLLKREAL